ncbi:hypothetical protein [Thermococcus nautili]|uniref:Uncharacterized protein n=2 Tax=Thermococcus nautili TaxID=195522 RepID=U3RHM2_9EURY|nr:hypothetical protein [Thermococcus nautili]AGX15323.1 hypothetical protein TNaP3-09 [Thermococcus nautili]AHL21648.1 hypothetical protein BD01_0009 [Thermococcus nautili]
MSRRGRPPVMKAWRVRITQPGEEPLEFTLFAKTREKAEEMARFMVHQSFPFARFTVKKIGRVL